MAVLLRRGAGARSCGRARTNASPMWLRAVSRAGAAGGRGVGAADGCEKPQRGGDSASGRGGPAARGDAAGGPGRRGWRGGGMSAAP